MNLTAYNIIRHYALIFLTGLVLSGCSQTPAWSQSALPDFERLANAIYKAEGGAKTSHPYGILAKYKHTTPRQACINTCRNQWKRHQAHNCRKDYLTCLRNRYCPIGAENDPGNLNKNWLNNVRHFLNSDSLLLNTSVN